MEKSTGKRIIKLSELLAAVKVIDSRNSKDIYITGIAYNSNQVIPGDLFVAIKGYKTDGHSYIPTAVENGAAAVIVEDYREGIAVPQVRVGNSRQALSALSDKYYGHPSLKMKAIGITATKGKTTTAYMINEILENHSLKTGLISTVIVKIGDQRRPADLTTPESLDLQHYFYLMSEQKISHVIMEVSSSALELSRAEHADFDIVSLINISRDHIDLHGSFEKYVEVKSSLIKKAGPGKWAILNLDDPYSAKLVNETRARVLTFGLKNRSGDISCNNLDLSTGRPNFILEINRPFVAEGKEYKPAAFNIELSIMGYQTVYNAMVAAITGLLCGVPVHTIQESLKSFKGVERRFEVIFEDHLTIIDDHCDTGENVHVTLKTLQYMKYNNLRLIYSIRGSRGPTVNRDNAEAIAWWAPKLGMKEVVVTLSNSHVSDKDQVTDEEKTVFEETLCKAGVKMKLFKELPDAISYAFSAVEPGDIVVLGGSQGMDYGARFALEKVSQSRPDIDRDQLFKPLKNRVAGNEGGEP